MTMMMKGADKVCRISSCIALNDDYVLGVRGAAEGGEDVRQRCGAYPNAYDWAVARGHCGQLSS